MSRLLHIDCSARTLLFFRQLTASAAATPGKASPIFRTVSKSIVLLDIGERDSVGLTFLLFLDGINMASQVDVVVIIPESLNPFKISPDRSGANGLRIPDGRQTGK